MQKLIKETVFVKGRNLGAINSLNQAIQNNPNFEAKNCHFIEVPKFESVSSWVEKIELTLNGEEVKTKNEKDLNQVIKVLGKGNMVGIQYQNASELKALREANQTQGVLGTYFIFFTI